MDTQCSACRRVVAKYICHCASVPLCSVCLGPHIDTEGTHTPAPISKQAASKPPPQVQHNEVCDECRAKPAVRFCLCTAPLLKYCEACDVAHYRNSPFSRHSEHPMSAYKSVSSGRVALTTFTKKQQFINDLQLHLSLELVKFDAFVSQVGENFDNLLAFVASKKETLMTDLQAQRVKLAGLLNSAQHTIDSKRYAESFKAKTYLENLLLTGYQGNVPAEITLFAGTVDLTKAIAALEKSVTFEIGQDLQQLIPVITGTSLKLYHPQTLRMFETKLSKATRIDAGTAYCYIRPDTLLCCGRTYDRSVWEVNVKTGAVERVASMNAVRAYTGLWKYRNDCVYAFGGQKKQECCLNTAEAYSISEKTWSYVRSFLQAAKYMCSVCEHADNLYISGLSIQNDCSTASPFGSSIERFNSQGAIFTLLHANCPNLASVMCSDGKGLYCILQGTIQQADFSNASKVAFVLKANIPVVGDGNYWLCCPMKWSGDELTGVFGNSAGPFGLFRFSPAKWQFTQVANLV